MRYPELKSTYTCSQGLKGFLRDWSAYNQCRINTLYVIQLTYRQQSSSRIRLERRLSRHFYLVFRIIIWHRHRVLKTHGSMRKRGNPSRFAKTFLSSSASGWIICAPLQLWLFRVCFDRTSSDGKPWASAKMGPREMLPPGVPEVGIPARVGPQPLFAKSGPTASQSPPVSRY